MKHKRKPTRKQALLIREAELDPMDWYIVKNLDSHLEIVHRHQDKIRIVKKRGK